jgi:hypothetical protein
VVNVSEPSISEPTCVPNPSDLTTRTLTQEVPLHFATILTTSSSATKWLSPTLCGTCRALAPHTMAYLNVSLSVRWIWSHTSSMVLPLRTMSASLKSGSMPFRFLSYH